MNKKQILIGTISALISGILLNVIVPSVLQFIISAFLSAATILDPLYAKGRVETFWTAFIIILILQIAYAILVSFIIGISVAFLSQKIKSGWIYAANVVLSLAVHYILLCIFSVFSLIFIDKDAVFGFTILFAILITITAPIIGLISTAFVRKNQVVER